MKVIILEQPTVMPLDVFGDMADHGPLCYLGVPDDAYLHVHDDAFMLNNVKYKVVDEVKSSDEVRAMVMELGRRLAVKSCVLIGEHHLLRYVVVNDSFVLDPYDWLY